MIINRVSTKKNKPSDEAPGLPLIPDSGIHITPTDCDNTTRDKEA